MCSGIGQHLHWFMDVKGVLRSNAPLNDSVCLLKYEGTPRTFTVATESSALKFLSEPASPSLTNTREMEKSISLSWEMAQLIR